MRNRKTDKDRETIKGAIDITVAFITQVADQLDKKDATYKDTMTAIGIALEVLGNMKRIAE